MQTTLIPILAENGEPQFLLILSEDITDARMVETQLRQSQKMEAIGNLIGGMAHDFNNLLSVIIGNLDLLQAQIDDANPSRVEIKGLGSEALEAALKGADLTQRLLAFARRQPLQPRNIAINDLVKGTVRLLSRTLGDDIEIRLDLEDQVSPVVADPAQLEASLINICNTARDAMPEGGMLAIATRNQSLDADYAMTHDGIMPGNYVVIEISDSGSGMPSEVASRIFEPFFTTKEMGRGTGPGLSMVFGFIKQSKGHVNVYSEPGHGTTFRLFLPSTAAVAAIIEPDGATARGGGHETILAVEDNAGLRRIVARQIKSLGYRFLEAEDGVSALAILKREKVDLLFSDIMMPGGMSGVDLARDARSRWPSIKVLLTSGFPDSKVEDIGNAAAKFRLLSKPCRKEDLARALREMLDAA